MPIHRNPQTSLSIDPLGHGSVSRAFRIHRPVRVHLRPQALLGLTFLIGLLLPATLQADPPDAYERPNKAYTVEPTNPYSGRTDLQFRRPFSYGTTRQPSIDYRATTRHDDRDPRSLAPRNRPDVGIRNEPGIGVRNEAGTGIRNEPGVGVRNRPGVGIEGTSDGAVRNNPGVAVRNNPGIAVRNTPSADAYTTHPDVRQTLPREHRRIRHRGRTWYHVGHRYYRPVYRGSHVHYMECYPPIGYVVDALPDFAQTIVVDNTTYHTVNNAWFVPTSQDGRTGYQVVPPKGSDQQQIDQPQPAGPSATAPAAEDPDPFELARAMSDFLADLPGFALVASDVYESRDERGRLVRRTNRRTFNLSRPHHLIVDVRGDDGNLRAYYDGRNLAIHHRDADAYSILPVPSTLDAMLEDLARRFDLAIPLADLLYDNVYEAVIGQADQAQYLGTDRIGPVETHRLFFWNDEIDWELWIDTGTEPLPRKIIITYKTLPGAPRYAATIRQWRLSPDFPPGHFRFHIPSDAQRVELQPVRDAPADAGETGRPEDADLHDEPATRPAAP